jgi:hypothetical protein
MTEANFRIISQRKDERTLLLPELPRRLRLLLLLTEERCGVVAAAAVVLLMPTRCFQSASATTLQVLTTAALTLSSSHVTCRLSGAISSARDCKDVRGVQIKKDAATTGSAATVQ